MKLLVRFERPRDEMEGPVLGPYEWLQLTYDALRCSPDGETIAMQGEDDHWYIGTRCEPVDGGSWQRVSAEMNGEPYSGVTVFVEQS